MNFDLPGEDDPRRLEVRRWLESHPNPSYRDLYEQGYSVPHWPKPWGIEADPELQFIIDDEIERTGMMLPAFKFTTSIAMVAKLLLTYGTEWQREHFLPSALSGEQFWAMLATEPSGGSDLAALRTVAIRDGNDYVPKGTKIWNGGADAAQIGVVLARTDASAPKHAGISLFLVEMDTPGITATPIKDMMGQNIFEPRMSDFNEVVFDNARIPASHRIGEEGQGWMLGTLILQNERAHLARPSVAFGLGPTARELVAGLDEIGALDDPVMADRLSELFVEGEVLRVLALQVLRLRTH